MATELADPRYPYRNLLAFARSALAGMGVAPAIAAVMAERVLDADLHGHSTHGMRLLSRYLAALDAGTMAREGEIEVVSDRGGAALWDGHMLPGHYVLDTAVRRALERVRTHGAVTIAIRRSDHAGALQVYLPQATAAGCMILIWATDTQMRSVAPFGGLDPVLTSEPVAIGIPTGGEPILIDISTSLSSNAAVKRALARGERMPSDVLLDGHGNPTDDPAVLEADPPGTILPLGGLEHGYKGFGLALAVSALALGLPGWGRTAAGKTQGILVQLLDPAAFGGTEAFRREADWMVEASHGSRVRPGDAPVRLPGERALALARRQRATGVRLAAEVPTGLAEWAERLGVGFPEALP